MNMVLLLLIIIPVSLGYFSCLISVKLETKWRLLLEELKRSSVSQSRKSQVTSAKFKNTLVEEFLDEEGIKHEFSTLYTPQQNSVVERKNRTLIDMARTMLDEYKTPDIFWCDAVNTACHAINHLYLHKKLKKTSYELLTCVGDLIPGYPRRWNQ